LRRISSYCGKHGILHCVQDDGGEVQDDNLVSRDPSQAQDDGGGVQDDTSLFKKVV